MEEWKLTFEVQEYGLPPKLQFYYAKYSETKYILQLAQTILQLAHAMDMYKSVKLIKMEKLEQEQKSKHKKGEQTQ